MARAIRTCVDVSTCGVLAAVVAICGAWSAATTRAEDLRGIAAPAVQAGPEGGDRDEAAPEDPAEAAAWLRKQQMRQQRKQLEQFFMPILWTELEVARNTCSSLSPEARKQVLAAGRTAVKNAAEEQVAQQFKAGVRTADPRRMIQKAVAAALEPHVTAEERTAYEATRRQRVARRDRAARIRIIALLDRQLDLTGSQRQAIEADLEKRWQEAWGREVHDSGVQVNNYPPAPDFADPCIAPHLNERQREEWAAWREAAGSQRVGFHARGLHHDGQGLQADNWWGN